MNRSIRWKTTAAIVLVGLVLASGLQSARSAERTLTVPEAKGRLHIAPALPNPVKSDEQPAWQLKELERPEAKALPVQFVPWAAEDGKAGRSLRAAASIPAGQSAAGPRRFQLEPAKSGDSGKQGFQFKELDDKSLELRDGDRPVLVYNHGVITDEKVPKNDARRSRACYIHPVYGIDGEVLTEDFPKDHYHHHGIFWAWPHIRIDGKEYDLWTYGKIKQQFVQWLAREAGPVAAVLGVENGWFVGDKKVMIERVWLRVYQAADGQRAMDLEFVFIPTDKPVTLWGAPGKSYGGLNLRFAPRKDTVITVPSGRTKEDLPDTPLAWADFTAKFPDAPGPSGAAILVDPAHPDFPPTWLTRHYGILCVGWPGVKPQTFSAGTPIHLSYRVLIHKGAAELEQLKQASADYDAGTKAKVEAGR